MIKASKNRKIVSEKPMRLIILPRRDGGNAHPSVLVIPPPSARNSATKFPNLQPPTRILLINERVTPRLPGWLPRGWSNLVSTISGRAILRSDAVAGPVLRPNRRKLKEWPVVLVAHFTLRSSFWSPVDSLASSSDRRSTRPQPQIGR